MQEKNTQNVNFIIERLMQSLQIATAAGLADYLQVATSTVSSWKNRNTLDYPLIIAVCKSEGISLDWLLNGEEEVTAKEIVKKYPKEKVVISEVGEPLPNYKKPGYLPLIPSAAFAGVGAGDMQVMDKDVIETYYVPEFSKADFLIPVKGDSMKPSYQAGDFIACKKQQLDEFIVWGNIYLLDTTSGILLKRITPGGSLTSWILKSDNKDYSDIIVEVGRDIYSIARVLGGIRFES